MSVVGDTEMFYQRFGAFGAEAFLAVAQVTGISEWGDALVFIQILERWV